MNTMFQRASLAAIALCCYQPHLNADPITYNLNPLYQNINSFDYGVSTTGTWSITGTITTDGEVAPSGAAVGTDPGYLRDSHGDFLAYDLTASNDDLGLSYTFSSTTPLSFADNNGLYFSGSYPTYGWANDMGDLLLGNFAVRNTENHPTGAILYLESNSVRIYDYAVNNYVFGSSQLASGSPYSFTLASTNFPAAVPAPGTIGVLALGLMLLSRLRGCRLLPDQTA